MGRTKRRRNKIRKEKCDFEDYSMIIALQKSLRLKCGNLKISFFKSTGRGMKCMKNFNTGDVLIALPLNSLIVPQSLNSALLPLKTWDSQPQLDLTVLLVYENHLKNESKYFDYLNTLPKSYSNLYFCTIDEIKLLPDFIQKLAIVQKKSVQFSFQMMMKSLKNANCPHCQVPFNDIFTPEMFDWAWFTVNTRSVYYQNEYDLKPSLALAPYLDLLNHSSEANTEMIIDHKKKLYILKTMVELKIFQEAFIKYGCHSNITLFLEYGFTTPNNPYDFVEFSFEEVLDGVQELNYKYGNITKIKKNFIIQNKLNENLKQNIDGFSWNLNVLIFVLITEERDYSVFQKKAYSGILSPNELAIINKTKEVIVDRKVKKFLKILCNMNEIKQFTQSYKVAKQLIKIFIHLLTG